MTDTELRLRRGLAIPDDAARVLFLAESSHWDPNWLLSSEVYYERLVRRNLEQAIEALEDEPDRVYSVECVFFLRMFWERNPEKQDTLRRLVNQRRLRLTGSGVTTADTLLPSSEAILRDWLLGQEWLRRNGMHQEPRLAYFTDSFGASSCLPSLLRAAGFDRTAITRLDGMHFLGSDWEPKRRFPRSGSSAELLLERCKSVDFVWRDANGAEVLCHWNAFGYGQGDMLAHRGISRVYLARLALPARREGQVERRIDSYVRQLEPVSRTPYLFCPIGFDFVEPIPRLLALVDRYNRGSFSISGTWVVNAGLDDYLALIECRRDRLPVVALDPNPYWTGFYASRPALKRQCRDLADSLVRAEGLVASSPRIPADAEVGQSLADAWWVAATSNHHDFITGTSPDSVVRGEQLPWLRAARAKVESVISRLERPRGAGGPPGEAGSPREAGLPPEADPGARWRRERGWPRLEAPGCSVELSETGGGVRVSLGGSDRSLEITDDIVVYRDSGGLWRMGHEFRGGSLVPSDRACHLPATWNPVDGPGIEATARLVLGGTAILRSLRLRTGGVPLAGRIEGHAAAGTTVVFCLATGLSPGVIAMAEPGGVAVRPLRKLYAPTYWPAQDFVHIADPKRGQGLVVYLRYPTGVAWRENGRLELVALRNATRERAWGFVPLLANPARGFEPEDATFEYALAATTGAGGREADVSAMARTRASLWAADAVLPAIATIEQPRDGGVRVSALKNADRGVGLILRLMSPRPPGRELRVTLNDRTVRAAWLCDARERDIREVPVRDGAALVMMEGTIASVRLLVQGEADPPEGSREP